MAIRILDEQTGDLDITILGNVVHVMSYICSRKLQNSEIEKFCNIESIRMKRAGHVGTLCVNADYNIGCRTGKRTEIGKPVNVFDPAEWEVYKARDIDFKGMAKVFRILWYEGQFVEFDDDTGGVSYFNDCLFEAIESVYGKLPKIIRTADKFKKFLNLSRYCRVSIELIPKIEEVLNCRISVYGSHIYSSSRDSTKHINLYLRGSHYSVHRGKTSMKQTKDVSFVPKTPEFIYSYSQAKDGINIFQSEMILIGVEQFREMKKSYKYLLLKSKIGEEEQTRNEFITNQKIVLDELGINLFKYSSLATASMDIWKNTSAVVEPDEIDFAEDSFLSCAFKAGIRYAEVGYSGVSWLYDINSMYPYIMTHQRANFPIKEGVAMTITEFDSYVKYGIYHCKIEGEHKLFTHNPKNYYTHHDINLANLLKLSVSLITGKGHNFYYYEKSKLETGARYFGNYINALYPHKAKGGIFKQLLNTLWGALASRNYTNTYIKMIASDDVRVEAPPDLVRLDFDFKTGLSHFKSLPRDQISFRYSYARIAVFLTSFARYQFAKMVLPYTSQIIRIHTDSILTNVAIDGLPISEKLGEWKVEHEGINIKILNKNKYISL